MPKKEPKDGLPEIPAEIKQLEETIRKYQESYYSGEAEVSDSEFDLLWDKLKKLDPNHPLLAEIEEPDHMTENKRRTGMSNLLDYKDYSRFTDRQETDKAFHMLEGILKGINIDRKINQTEIAHLKNWCADYYHYVKRPPFNEAITLILNATDDGIITEEEYADISWLCKNICTPNKYFNAVTSDIQRLHGILHGILTDGIITADELTGLLDWINDHPEMANSYPYDEIETLLYKVLEDKTIDEEEQKLLTVYFSQFVDTRNTAINEAELDELRKTMSLPLICTMNPNLQFDRRLFCFTGISAKYKRQEIAEKITALGGLYNDHVTKKTEYLIVGDKNNPSWAFSVYGRKVESAIEYRKSGTGIQIVKEVDFWDEADSR